MIYRKEAASLYDQSNRYRFNGKEEQAEFGTPYIDYGARQYDPAIGRWLSVDPLAEKYYSISPYAFCNNNPVNYVDLDGRFPDFIWDLASIGFGVNSFRDNYRAGKYGAAIFDGVGIAIDAVAAAVPFIPGGVGAVRAGAKAVNAIDNAADAGKAIKAADRAEIAESTIREIGGENAFTKLGREKHKEYNPGDEYIKEFRLPSGKRADAVSFEKRDVRELKPNNSRAIKRGEKQVQAYRDELQTIYPDVKWEYHVDVYEK